MSQVQKVTKIQVFCHWFISGST